MGGVTSVRWVLSTLVGIAFAAACSSSAGEGPTPGTEPQPTLTLAATIAKADSRLSAALAPRAERDGFQREAAGFSSPGLRAAQEKKWTELGAFVGASATEPYSVGISTFPALRLTVTRRRAGERADVLGAKPVGADLDSGTLVYREAYGDGVDAIVTASPSSFEELILFREATAHMRLEWTIELPSGIARGAMQPDGTLWFIDARGHMVLAVPKPFAVDSAGVRRDARLEWDDAAGVMAVSLDATDLTFPVLLDPAFDTTTWKQVGPVLPPGARVSHGMAADRARNQVVIFGGESNAGPLGDTVVWSPNHWSTLSPVHAPSARSSHAMVFDGARNEVVLFGGFGSGLKADTWTWDGSDWTNETPSTSPPARRAHAMAYDAARGKVVLFGGFGSAELGDTWTWDGSTWKQESPSSSPPARYEAAMAYDDVHGNVVLFGGVNQNAQPTNDTWIWNGSTWTDVSASAGTPPKARKRHSLAFDPSSGMVSLFGGSDDVDVRLGDTWSWNGSTWKAETPAPAPSVRELHAMAVDPAGGGVLLYGGGNGSALDETWTWKDAKWSTPQNPTPRAQTPMAFHQKEGQGVLYGADFWLRTDTWSQQSAAPLPPARLSPTMAYDAAHEQVVLFGGQTASLTFFDDTWLWNGVGWTEVVPAAKPGLRIGQAMAYDTAHSQVVLFGGRETSGTHLTDTWSWNGANWKQESPSTSPSARWFHAVAYDAARAEVVLFGGEFGIPLNDTWTWNGSTWTQKSPAASPGARAYHTMAYDLVRQRVVLFGGRNVGELGDTWSWDGTTWTQESPAASPSPRWRHAMAYDATRKQTVLFGGSGPVTTPGSSAALGDTWTLLSTAGGACTSTIECATGTCVDGVCCNTPCTGQCEACNLATSPGVCSPATGAPVGTRPACSSGGANVCAGKQCDGIDRTTCAALVGASVSCRAASCSNSVATVPASCDGAGQCPALSTVACTPYACNGAACGTTCANDTQCALGFVCNLSSSSCVPQPDAGTKDGAANDGSAGSGADAGTLDGGTAGGGGVAGDAGSAAAAGAGAQAGTSAGGSTASGGSGGFAAAADASPDAATSGGASEDGGCDCSTAPRGSSRHVAWLGLVLFAFARRRRRGVLSAERCGRPS